MSNLSFTNTEILRNNLLQRNLDSSYGYSETLPKDFTDSTYSTQGTGDLSVVDQLDVEEAGQPILDSVGNLNRYSPEQYSVTSVQTIINSLGSTLNYLESFTPVEDRGALGMISILTGNDRGEGDSEMVQIARQQLKNMSLATMGVKLNESTLGRINALDAINDSTALAGLLSGREKLIERDYQITVPGNPITRAAEYFGRVSGVELPVSYIPGEFFEGNIEKGKVEGFFDKAKTAIGQALNLDFNSHKKSYSQKLLQYTSGGQKSRLFQSVNYNKYQPNFDTSVGGTLNNIIDAVQGLAGLDPTDGAFYYGSGDVDPGTVFTMDSSTNRERAYYVSGPSKMVKMFEGDTPLNTFPENDRRYLTGTNPANTQTNFIWFGDNDERRIKYDSSGKPNEDLAAGIKSNEKTIKPDTLLGKTQQIVQDASSLNGEARLKHPGTIISNVAYKYHDGYKIISKGNAVRGEDDDFCRVWTKDYGYDRYGRLVRHKGIQDTQRRIPGSVIKSQMNLNIGPTRDEDGKPINFGFDETGKNNISKYMFSIENLAWSGSDKLKDRPLCEQGPNDGRIMWFPPYDLKYTDDNRANWTTHTFLGRPEPIYTYNNAERSGTISFKVVVDHPSIFNLLRNKYTRDTPNHQKQELMDSFVAGCKDFDIYELANEFITLNYEEIQTLEQYLNANVEGGLKTDKDSPGTPKVIREPSEVTTEITPIFKEKYGESTDIQLYWYNDIPGPQNSRDTKPNSNFDDDLNSYIDRFNGSYQDKGNKLSGATQQDVAWGESEIEEFKQILLKTKETIEEIKKTVQKTLEQDERFTFEILIEATTSAVATQQYNDALASRRAESLKEYLLGDELKDKEKRINIKLVSTGENEDFSGINCNTIQEDVVSGVDERIYSKSATYCRTARATIKVLGRATNVDIDPGETVPTVKYEREEQFIKTESPDVVLGLLMKAMHSECDYFQELKEDSPLVYDNLMDKLKYFQPGFHSTTPEGLNKRLTFLQQCLRPGETIKVFDEQKNEVTDISSNTTFGRPPVCILRIGDFFHTKMVVDNVNFSYDESLWDMNPEGIGMQPMIASVNMGVKFIGGHGISEVVNELQNALSFNYYANTEVYDDMATPTDGGRDKEYMDKVVKAALNDKRTEDYAKKLNNPEVSPDNDSYWGNLTENDDHLITYNQFYNEMVSQINDYANQVITETKVLTETYGQTAVNMLFHTKDKNNYKATIKTSTTDTVDVEFIGRTTYDYNEDYSKILQNVEEHLDSGDLINNPIYAELKKKMNFNGVKDKEFIKISKYILSEIRDKFNTFGEDISSSLQNIFNKHKTLQKSIDAFNIILGDEIDGFYDTNTNEYVVKYLNNLTANNGDLSGDVNTSLTKLNSFVEDITDKVRSATVVSSTGEHIINAKKSVSLSVRYFYDEILPFFLKRTSFDIDSAISNNSAKFNNRKLRKEYGEQLVVIKNKPIVENFNVNDYKWDNLSSTNVIYDFRLTESTDPANETKLKDYYDIVTMTSSSIENSDESDYIWKIDGINVVTSTIQSFNIINGFGGVNVL